MNKKRLLTVMGSNVEYYKKIKKLFGSSLIGYWPEWDLTGIVAEDVSGNDRDGAYANVTLGQLGIGDGRTSVKYGAAGAWLNLKTDSLASVFNGSEYGIFIWAKALSADTWSDTTAIQKIFGMGDTSSRQVIMYKNTVAGQLRLNHSITGTSREAVLDYVTTLDWFQIGITGSAKNNRIIHYYNGIPTPNGAGAFTEAMALLNTMSVGARYVPDQLFNGFTAHVFLTNREPTAAEVLKAATVNYKPVKMSFIGDSIAALSNGFPILCWQQYQKRSGYVIHAGGGATIMVDMPNLVIAAASDNADIIVVELGTNDDDDAGITAKYTTNMTALKASNPNARIYGLGILPRTGGGNIAVNNPRIQAACVAAGVTYIDPEGWIDPATDTSDGVHPTAAGNQKIATELLAII